MNKEALISVLLPIYNVEQHLHKCMDSILGQTYSNIEIIMINDGSTDKCPEICDEYMSKDHRVVVVHKSNGGVSEARNCAVEKAKGDYITWVDPDDFVSPDYVEYMYSLLKKYDTKMAICQHQTMSFDNKKAKHQSSEVMDAETCLEKMLYHNIIDTSVVAKIYHRSLFKHIRYPIGKLFEDIGTTYALIIKSEMVAVGYEKKYSYIYYDKSIVNSVFRPSKLDMIEMTDKMAFDVLNVFPNLKRAVFRRRVYSRISTLNQMLQTKDCSSEKAEIISFIRNEGSRVLHDKNASRRDKGAIILIKMNYFLYRSCWLSYRSIKNKLRLRIDQV